MKVIDLLNKIANGEIPKTIVYDEKYFTYDDKRQNYFAYVDSEIDWKYIVMEYINDEVEIIEDTPKEEKKKPEKWNDLSFTTMRKKEDSIDDDIHKLKGYIETIMRTQNEIIDYLKSKGDE